MHHTVFDDLVTVRFNKCLNTLTLKSEEYARDGDRLHNFKTAARIDNETPEKALWGMWKKHIVSIRDMIHDIDKGILPSESVLNEKMTDNIDYTVLLEGLIRERMNKDT